MSLLNKDFFHKEKAAFQHLESILWPNGPVCPHCGQHERIYVLEGVKDKKGRVRPGLKKCGHCRKQFTVRVNTVFESAHIPLHKMLQAVFLLTSSKKGFSAHQLHRVLEITYKSAWFLAHRIRLARDLVWDSGIEAKDSLHVASALEAGLVRFHTFDVGLLNKSGKIGNPPLIIEKPSVAQPKLRLVTK